MAMAVVDEHHRRPGCSRCVEHGSLRVVQALGAGELLTTHQMSSVVSVALGALLANIVSVVLMVIETANFRRH